MAPTTIKQDNPGTGRRNRNTGEPLLVPDPGAANPARPLSMTHQPLDGRRSTQPGWMRSGFFTGGEFAATISV